MATNLEILQDWIALMSKPIDLNGCCLCKYFSNFFFRTKIYFRTKIFFGPKFFFRPKLFLDHNFFSDQNFFLTKIFFQTKIFLQTKIFFGPKFFSGPKFFEVGGKIWGYSSLIYRKPTYRILAPHEAWNPSKSFR